LRLRHCACRTTTAVRADYGIHRAREDDKEQRKYRQSIDQLARRLCANNHGEQQDQGEQTEENKNSDTSITTGTRMFSNDKSKANTKTIFLEIDK
jgi:hypothetical protein